MESLTEKVVLGCALAVTVAVSGIAFSTEANARCSRWAWSVGGCGAGLASGALAARTYGYAYLYWYGPYAYSPYYSPLSLGLWTDRYAPYPYYEAFYP
jgi:hypothetical protein